MNYKRAAYKVGAGTVYSYYALLVKKFLKHGCAVVYHNVNTSEWIVGLLGTL